MASYRFCRSDDVPALVEAFNLCYRPHFADEPQMTVERFRALSREFDLWTSSCMLARSGADPIGVLLATKRQREALVWCIGIRPGHERQGHGRHLLTSLSQKLAILGPPRMLAEVPEPWTGAAAFFNACGWRREDLYTDFRLSRPPAPERDRSLVIPVTLDELEANGVWDAAARRAWRRSPATLAKRKERISGIAVASPERIEAWLLYEDDPGGQRRILACGHADPDRAALWQGLLLDDACSGGQPVLLERASAREIDFDLLRSRGFDDGARTVAYATEPTPA